MYTKMQESGCTEIIPLIFTWAIWNRYPVFSHPEFSRGSLCGVNVAWWVLDAGILSFLSSLRAHQLTTHGGCNCCGIICLLIFHFACSHMHILWREMKNSSLSTYGCQFENRQNREGWLHRASQCGSHLIPRTLPCLCVPFAFLQRLSSWILKAWGIFLNVYFWFLIFTTLCGFLSYNNTNQP